jgi:hypothetical protein
MAKDGKNIYVVYFVGATQRATLDIRGMQVILDTKGVFKRGDIVDKPYRTTGGSFTLVLQKTPGELPPGPDDGETGVTIVTTSSGLSAGAIVAIVVGSLLVVAAVASVIVVSIKKRKTPQK